MGTVDISQDTYSVNQKKFAFDPSNVNWYMQVFQGNIIHQIKILINERVPE